MVLNLVGLGLFPVGDVRVRVTFLSFCCFAVSSLGSRLVVLKLRCSSAELAVPAAQLLLS